LAVGLGGPSRPAAVVEVMGDVKLGAIEARGVDVKELRFFVVEPNDSVLGRHEQRPSRARAAAGQSRLSSGRKARGSARMTSA
jgi:hypothetical protein